ncbi:MAG: thioredoxin domain-containing protein [Planctomycetes bacterium]|nr:thioredoxin domain-containing protein [Planctomycetota bacterium]MCW8136266.1 thioredoxin domain-containing protein [Planctomycetota bacterium]
MTEHKPNALIHEASPYLLQHAYNPVDWMPWGEAAFEKAARDDKLVFLSIGYATCHWCHVMERESFENQRIAEYLNANFVPIKVDREERPDIDAVYMAVTQALNEGHGGWPMSVWLTPQRQPVTAGTYFPPEDKWGRAGFLTVLGKLADLWKTDRARLIEQATHITDWLRGQGAPAVGQIDESALRENVQHHARRFDARYGGFDGSPKFPTPHRVQALLHYAQRGADALASEALSMAEITLDNMARGGLHDHVGGGFHRYSTDREWLTPHFEKMLYDNALMIESYLDAWLITGKQQYAEVVRNTAGYILRDLRDPAGPFYSAEDADSEGEEGKFYVWSMAELKQLLGNDADLAAFVWGCTEAGNYRDEATHESTGANILHLPRTVAESASARGFDEAALRKRMFDWRNTLFDERAKRVRPLLDDKSLADWNGLAIAALARAGATLPEPEYLQSARKAAEYILNNMLFDGRLMHRARKGKVAIKGFAGDYAFMIGGLIALYQADFDTRWLQQADRLAAEMLRLFMHDEGLLHLAGSDEEDVMIAPHRETHDGAIPSANAAAAYALVRLGRLLQRDAYVQAAGRILEAMSGSISTMPAAHGYALLALEWLVWPAREVVIAAADATQAQPMLAEARRNPHPRTLLVLRTPGSDIETLIPSTKAQAAIEGKPTAYVCENYACRAPVTDMQTLRQALA